jgi:hypothetical protein
LSEGLPRLPGIHPLRRGFYPLTPLSRLAKARVDACHKKPGRTPYRSAEGRSEARRAKRLIYCLAFISSVSAQKAHVKAPNPPNPFPSNNIRLSYELPSNRYTGYRSKNKAQALKLRAQPIENKDFSCKPFVMTILQMQNPATD